jgi:hypothetical protein
MILGSAPLGAKVRLATRTVKLTYKQETVAYGKFNSSADAQDMARRLLTGERFCRNEHCRFSGLFP